MPEVPDRVRLKAMAQGAEGRRWLEELDNVVCELEEAWSVDVVDSLTGGTESYTAAVRRDDGSEAVLKISIPGNDLFGNEARTLEAAQGHGYVELFAYDAERRALLLERLGPRLSKRSLTVEDELAVLTETLQRAWEVSPPAGLEPLSEKGERLERDIRETWERLGKPCPDAVVETAGSFVQSRLAAAAAEAVLLHGDAHAHNALEAGGGRVKLVDPDGLVGERAYDLGILLRELEAPRGRERCSLLANMTGVDGDAIWEWGFVERVSTGLLCLDIGARGTGRRMLGIADEWLDA